MADRIDFKNRDDLWRWLNNKPDAWGRIIAVRAALRVLPFAMEVPGRKKATGRSQGGLVLAAIRANFVSWSMGRYPDRDIAAAARAAAAAAAARAAAAAAAAAYAADDVAAAPDAPDAAAAAAAAADEAYAYAVIDDDDAFRAAAAARIGIWQTASRDAEWLAQYVGQPEAERARDLVAQPLWPKSIGVARPRTSKLRRQTRRLFDDFAASELAAEFGFAPWIDWYRGLLPDPAGARPKDYFGEALTLRIANQPGDWWKRGPAAVNADIAGWLKERPEGPIPFPQGTVAMPMPTTPRIFVRLPDTLARDFNRDALRAPSPDLFQRMLTLGPGGDMAAPLPKGAAAPPVGRMLTDDSLIINNPDVAAFLQDRGATLYADVQFKIFNDGFQPDAVALPEETRNWYWDAGATPLPMAGENASLDDVLRHIKAPAAWNLSEGDGATIAVIDTGIHPGLLEIGDNRRSRFNADTVHEDRHWVDKVGHGSMCAVIAAGGGAGARFGGVAPLANVVSCRTDFLASDIADIYGTLIEALGSGRIGGPLIVNNSYGLYACQSPGVMPADHPFLRLIEHAVDLGIVVVFAAGNNHHDVLCRHDPRADRPDTIWGPNSHDKVLSVGTVNRANTNQDPATPHVNSSRGPGEWAVDHPKPDCVAPTYGTTIWGSDPRPMAWWGTSGAAPQAAGLAALIQSYGVTRLGGAFQTSEVNDIIRQSCRRLEAPRTCVGHGLIDCAAALEIARRRRERG